MAAALGSLIVDIGANVARLQRDMNRAQHTFKKGADRMRRIASSLGSALVAGFGVTALIRSTKATLDAADKYAKMSRSIGISVEKLSAFNHVAELSGTSFDTIAKGAGRLSRNMKDVRDGTSEYADTFKELGVSVVDGNNQLRDTNDVILDIATRFSKLPDGPLKTAQAMEVFGRAGADLIPMLNQGAAGIKAMQEEAERLGVTFDTKTANAAERINDQFTRVDAAFTGLRNNVIIKLLPDLKNISDMMFEAAANTGELDFAARVLSTGLKIAASAGVIVSTAFKIAGSNIGAAAAAVMAAANGEFSQAFDIIAMRAEDMGKELDEALASLNKIWNPPPDGGVTPIKTEVIQSVVDLSGAADRAYSKIVTLGPATVETTTMMEQGIARAEDAFGGALSGMVTGAEQSFGEILSSFLKMIAEMVIKAAVVQPLFNAISAGIGAGAGTSFKYAGADSIPMPSYMGNAFSRGRVVRHAAGGVVDRMGAFAMAGGRVGTIAEQGPEAIMPLTRIGGKLGVKASGGGNSTTHFHIDARGSSLSRNDLEQSVQRGAERAYRMVYDDVKRRGPIRKALS